MQAQLEAKLQEALTPVHLEVKNESHGECSGLQGVYRWVLLKPATSASSAPCRRD